MEMFQVQQAQFWKLFLNLKIKKKIFTVTDKKMTRFWLSINHALNFTLQCLNEMKGGELFVLKIPSIRILDLVKSFDQKRYEIVGLRIGEKIHETMCPKDEASLIMEFKDKFIISPDQEYMNKYSNKKFKTVHENFEYRSDNNDHFLNVNEIKKMNKNISKKFL